MILVLAVLAAASLFRLWHLDRIPPGLYPDEALNANQAWEAASEGTFRVFYPENNGREGLYMALSAFSFLFFGASVWSFRLVSAVAGIATAGAIIMLAFEFFLLLFERRTAFLAALLAGFLTAISFWHNVFSRVGFRAILTPLALCLAFSFLLNSLRTKRWQSAAISGVFFGIGLYTYLSFRIAVLPLLVILVIWGWISVRERWGAKFLLCAGALAAATALTVLPLAGYFLKHPEDLVSRTGGISVWNTEQPAASFLQSFGRHAAMFVGPGDGNGRHNYKSAPQILFPLSIFFLWGAGYAIMRTWNIVMSRSPQQSLREFGAFKALFALLFFFLLPGALTFEGVPHALRTIGAIPPAMILTSLGLVRGYGALQAVRGAAFARASLAILLAGSAVVSFQRIAAWGTDPAADEAFTVRFEEAADILLDVPKQRPAFLIASEGDLPLQVPLFLQRARRGREFSVVWPHELQSADLPEGSVLVTMNSQEEQLAPLRDRFPEGITERKKSVVTFSIPEQ